MRRTVIDSEKVKWVNKGGGSLYANIGGKVKIIKPGEVFSASLHEIPDAFRDVLRLVDPEAKIVPEVKTAPKPAPKPVPVEPVAEEETPTALEYSVVARSAGYWDVVDKDGKVMNEKALRAAAAEELAKSLEE